MLVTRGMLYSAHGRQLGRSLGFVQLVDPDTAVVFVEKGWVYLAFLPCELDLPCGYGDSFVRLQVQFQGFAFFWRCALNFLLKLHAVDVVCDERSVPIWKHSEEETTQHSD